MIDVLTDIAGKVTKAGAPVLGTLIGSAIGGPAGPVIGGLAGKAFEAVAEALGTQATPEAVRDAIDKPGAAEALQQVEARAPEMLRLWEEEARRTSAAQAAEIEKGFSAWQFWRNAIQAVVWGGWTVILASAVFGGNLGIKGNMALGEIVAAWGSVSMLWIIAFHGGHTAKELMPSFKWGRK